MTTSLLAIGTGKGLFLARSEDDRQTWEINGPHFPMTGVYAVGIDTRRYYAPPVHRTRAYRAVANGGHLPVTDEAAARVLTLPLWEGMTNEQVGLVAEAVTRIRRFLVSSER